MRPVLPLMLVTLGACGAKTIDDPFSQSTNPSATNPTVTDPTDVTASSGEESSGGGTEDPTTTSPTSTVDPDSGSSDTGPAVCGDGVISGEELCDGEDFGTLSCMSLGFGGGELVCTAMCQTYDSSGCYNCNNGVLENAEDCEDGVVPEGVDCVSEGFTTGEITCSKVTCQYDTSGCSLCGNGIVEGGEPCDGADLGGMDCAGVGFEMGVLACNAGCSYDFTGCSGGQYLQDFEGGAIPPEFDLPSAIDWSADSGNPIAGSWSAGSGDITNYETSTMTITATYAIAGTIEFSHEESTEDGYDYLEFWVDGAMLGEWSGIVGPADASYAVAAGVHTFEWRYRKDVSLDEGSDRVWVDDIVMTGGVPS